MRERLSLIVDGGSRFLSFSRVAPAQRISLFALQRLQCPPSGGPPEP
jgi:hypothetical protein